MSEYIINLSEEQDTALIEMGIENLENYIKAICNNHITQKIDAQLAAKTLEEKKALLGE